MTDTRTPKGLAAALEQRAASNEAWALKARARNYGGDDCIAEQHETSAALFRDAAAKLREMAAALEPFANCADELDATEDTPRAPDGEWAKFRLLTDDYRAARRALRGEP